MTRRVATALVAAVVVGAIALAPMASEAQVRDAGAPTTGTGVIYGRVTTGDGSTQPVRRAGIQVTGGRVGRAGMTDDSGRYVVDGLPDGHYTVVADRPPYVRTWAGAKSGELVPQATIDLVNGQRVEANIVMARGAVMSGLVVDPSGHPRPGQLVNALRLRTFNGKRSSVRGAGSGSGITDDRGVFRIFGLAAGDYVLSVGSQFGGPSVAPIMTDDELRWARQQLAASTGTAASPPPPPARAVGFSPVYYPGTADLASATPVALAAGEERDGLDIGLVAVPVASIDGTVMNADGSVPASPVQVLLNATANGSSATQSRPAQAGYFSFPNLPPGSYTLLARLTPAAAGGRAAGAGAVAPGGAPASRGPAMFASADVDVNGQDVKGLSLVLQPAMTVSGRATVDPAATGTIDLAHTRLTLSPVTFNGFGSPQPVSPAADGTFTFTDVMPGPYRLGMATSGGWTMKSATAGGVEILDAPLTIAAGASVSNASIVVSNHMASLTGSLLDAAGNGVPYYLVLFSADRTMWSPNARRTRQTRADSKGAFSFDSLPAGDYVLVVLPDAQTVDLADPDTYETLSDVGTKITLGDGEKKVQNFRTKG